DAVQVDRLLPPNIVAAVHAMRDVNVAASAIVGRAKAVEVERVTIRRNVGGDVVGARVDYAGLTRSQSVGVEIERRLPRRIEALALRHPDVQAATAARPVGREI